jgi:RNA polymerase sigma-70 factor (ECF subfamily)
MTAINDTFWQSTYRLHAPSVLAFLSSRLGRRDLAEDLLQETFVRAIRAQGALRDVSKIRSYLFSTAHRLVLNQFRRKRHLLFSEMGAEAAPIEREDVTAESPEEVTDLRRAELRLRSVVTSLTPALRTAFEGAVLQNKPYAEIARENGWSEGQVRVNVCRARKKVIAALREELKLDEGASE